MAHDRHLARGITRAVLTGARMRTHKLGALSATDALQGEHGIADGNRQHQRVVLTHRERRVLLHMEGWHATRDRARVPVVRLDDAERVWMAPLNGFLEAGMNRLAVTVYVPGAYLPTSTFVWGLFAS